MNTITTTNLRTQSRKLVQSLKEGSAVKLIHRSKVVGTIKPQKNAKVFSSADIKDLRKLAKDANVPPFTYKERDRLYRKRLTQKYGKDLS